MAPILSLPQEDLDRIRADVSLGVVSIWATDESSGPRKQAKRENDSRKHSFRSGFVYDFESGICTILTISKDLDRTKRIFVQFENGECFEAFDALGDKGSNLIAILVTGLKFEPKKIAFSEQNAAQCEKIIHMGNFDEGSGKLHFSSGSVGLVGHIVRARNGEDLTTFSHCCSERLHLLGGPVFNVRSKMVGMNYSKRDEHNIFFALDHEQLLREQRSLFGENSVHWVNFMMQALKTLRERGGNQMGKPGR